MWEYALDPDDVDADFVYETVCMADAGYCYDRERRVVVTTCSPNEAQEMVDQFGVRRLPERYQRLHLTRDDLLVRMEAARSLGMGTNHQMLDYLILAYLDDGAITDAYFAVAQYYA